MKIVTTKNPVKSPNVLGDFFSQKIKLMVTLSLMKVDINVKLTFCEIGLCYGKTMLK